MTFKYTFILYVHFFSDLLYPDNDSQSSSLSSKRREEATPEQQQKKNQMPSWFEEYIKEEKDEREREKIINLKMS